MSRNETLAVTMQNKTPISHDAVQAQRLSKLIQASQALAQIDSLEALLPQLLTMAQDVMAAEASSILLYNEQKKVLEFALAMNEVVGRDEIEILKHQIELPLGRGIAGWVGQHKCSANVCDVQSDPRFDTKVDEALNFVTRCLLCVPILHKESLLGVVQVLNAKHKDSFDASDQELLESFCYLAGVALVRSKLLEERLLQQKYQTQFETAARIQSHFKPVQPILKDGSTIWGYSEAAQYVGGDLYDIIPLEDKSYLVYVADVSGKGLPAALIMVALWTHIRSMATHCDALNTLMENVNQSMVDILGKEMFATIVMCRYWPETGACLYSVGGHMPPFLVSGNNVRQAPPIKGYPLGIFPNTVFQYASVTLQPGDSLLLLSDGVTEARDEHKDFFGEANVLKVFKAHSGPPWGETLVRCVQKWRKGCSSNDDMTVVEIYRQKF
ncbi:MAG: phosphoserine phosphatase RsbU/P [Desulfovibrionales bacterium]|jgi:serine phosphatase RsbU (regulator of sigma subunit)|nr:phosphoserine phosphatase RsbU/P [Desulfovibrionales bacterium]